jgi:hypothetical protein
MADVYTFWDALEHVPDLSFIEDLPCKTICISLPWCHHYLGKEWLEKWKHLKPDEHLHHFNRDSLLRFMKSHGWGKEVGFSSHEDIVRKGDDEDRPNILTMAFQRD